MTLAGVDPFVDLVLPEPIGLQPRWLASHASRKVMRVGRRGSKTRFALVAAIAGHGGGEDGAREFPGILEGGDVVWVAVDYPNLVRVVWKEEIKPRFGHLPWANLVERPPTCTLDGLGALHLVSAEAIGGIRGMGKNVRGIIVDEAAHLDLENALLDILLPVCLDNDAWLILMSTTNAGADGNTEKRTPSYFNLICEQIRAGGRGPEWEEFTGTAFDNPSISPTAIQGLIAEYPKDSVQLKQEVYADLLKAGAGIAFPEFVESLHVVPTRMPPRSWAYFGAMDWGYRQGSFGLYACSPDGDLEKVLEFVDGFSGLHAKDAALEITQRIKEFPQPEYIEADEQMWQVMGTGMTLAEEFLDGLALAYGGGHHAPQFRAGRHSAGSRAAKKNLVHRYLDYGAPGSVHRPDPANIKPWERPKFTVQERCVQTIKMFQTIPLDPKKPDDVDTTHPTDHQYDETAFALASRPPLGERVHAPVDQEHRDAGLDYEGKRVKDWQQDYGTEASSRGGLHTIPTHTRPTRFRVQGDA